jgi:hypothetical protein
MQRWLDLLPAGAEAAEVSKVQEWRAAYGDVRVRVPSRLYPMYARFDALSARVTYSRQHLRQVWGRAREKLRAGQFWSIQPGRLALAALTEVALMSAFARQLIASFEVEGRERGPAQS